MKRYIGLLLLVNIIYAFAPGRPTGDVPPLATQLERRDIDGFHCSWDMSRDVAQWAFPEEALYFPKNPQDITNAALQFVDAHAELFGTNSAELVPVEPLKRIGKYWLNLHQRHLGIPVMDGGVSFRIHGDGRVWGFGSKAISRFYPESGTPHISAGDATSAAMKQLEHARKKRDDSEPSLAWYPVDGVGRLAYQLIVDGECPDRFRCWVDAQTGELMGWTNLVNYDDVYGDVAIYYLPEFFDDSFQVADFQFGRITYAIKIAITDENGHYYLDVWPESLARTLRSRLQGLWADVQLMDGADAMVNHYMMPPASYNWTWTDEIAEPEELNLYYHTVHIHSYYERLDPDMTGLDYPVPARARVQDVEQNAYWDGYGTNYGRGGQYLRNLALFADVIYHEYTHGVTAWIYSDVYFPYCIESGALNESFSDYFACTNTGKPYAGNRVRTDDTYLRTLDNDLVYPDDWYGEVHYDSRIISAAYWDIRQGLYPNGVGRADSIIHFTRYSGANTFHDFAIECFYTADDDGDISNGCPNFGN